MSHNNFHISYSERSYQMQALISFQKNSINCAGSCHKKFSSYNDQSNGRAEACIKFVKRTMKKSFDTNADINLALLQIRSIPIGPATTVINTSIKACCQE